MDVDKLIKWVWLGISGIVLITIIVLIVGILLSGLLNNLKDSDDSGVAMNNLQKESQEKISLGLRYDYPKAVGDTEIYLIAVSVDYSNVNKRRIGSRDSYGKDFDVRQPSNIIFTDKNFIPIRRLLDKKGLIVDYDYPGDEAYAEFYSASGIPVKRKDSEQTHIAYRIALADTDDDGEINNEDASDVYISDLDGGNLLKVTSGWVIDDYKFMKDFSNLFIGFYEPEDEEKEILKFASYSIADKKLIVLDSLGKEIEETRKILKQ